MSLRRNIAASYASQVYVSLIGIVMVPVYIRYMGSEAYGLVGFYAMLQAWFQLLDMGLAPTMSRQTARFAGGALDALTLRRLLRVLETLFLGVAVLGGVALLASSHWVATQWLNASELPLEQVQLAVQWMAGIIGLRWMAGLYRSAIGGFEQQVWLGGINAATATARFVVVLVIFEWVGTTPSHFFAWQFLVAAAEFGLMLNKTYGLMPVRAPGGPRVGWHWSALSSVLRFSVSIAFTSAVWVAVTQLDKLVLSRILPLGDYGRFTLAVLAASGVSILSAPLSAALLPRLSRLQAERNEESLLMLYRQATQIMAVIAMPVAVALAAFAEPLLWAWTGDKELAAHTAPVLRLYAIGNGLLALGAFPYYLQFAKGDVKLHLLGNLVFIALLLPSIVVTANKWGGVGAGWAWLSANFMYLLLWTPLVHQRIAPGLHAQWLLKDVLPVPALVAVAGLIMANMIPWPSHRGSTIVWMMAGGLALLVTGILGSSTFRGVVSKRFGHSLPAPSHH